MLETSTINEDSFTETLNDRSNYFDFKNKFCSTAIKAKSLINSVLQEDNKTSHIWCNDYAMDIFFYLKEHEKSRRRISVNTISTQINFRSDLVNLLSEICETELLQRTTVHLAIYLLDIFMDNHTVDNLNTVAFACLLLAAKVEENDSKIPKLEDLNVYVKNPCLLNEYKKIESEIIRFFDWKLTYPTVATFIEGYIKEIFTEEDYYNNCLYVSAVNDENQSCNNFTEISRLLSYSTLEIVDFTLSDCNWLAIPPSRLAAACLAATRMKYNIYPIWPERLQELTRYKIETLLDHVNLLNNLFKAKKIQNQLEKVNDSGYISKIELDESDECPIPKKKLRL